MSYEDDLNQARKALSEFARLIDKHQARIDQASQRRDVALAALRALCRHGSIVEVELPEPLLQAMPGGPGRVRFCLDCGEGDFALPPAFQHVVLTGTPRATHPEGELARFLDRLHLRACFDEFDADGHAVDPEDDEDPDDPDTEPNGESN